MSKCLECGYDTENKSEVVKELCMECYESDNDTIILSEINTVCDFCDEIATANTSGHDLCDDCQIDSH